MKLFYSTFEKISDVKTLAHSLLEKKLIKCCNILSQDSFSIYEWEGQVQENTEILALFKVPDQTSEQFQTELAHLHPYETPCIIELSLNSVHDAFNKWMNEV